MNDRLHDLGLETKSELHGAIRCKETSISGLCTTAQGGHNFRTDLDQEILVL